MYINFRVKEVLQPLLSSTALITLLTCPSCQLKFSILRAVDTVQWVEHLPCKWLIWVLSKCHERLDIIGIFVT